MTYRTKYNIKTIDGIIRKFSPTNENNTEGIIIKLSNMTGIEKHKVLNILKPHIFFDDQLNHLEPSASVLPSVHVPFGVANKDDA